MDAIKLTDAKVKTGRIIPVYNMHRRDKMSDDNTQHFAIWVEDANGGNERCLLLTEDELKTADQRAQKFQDEIPAKGIITDMLD